MEELKNLDQEDESLNKWKASLLANPENSTADPKDPRKCIIKSFSLEVQGRPDVTIDLSAPGAVKTLKDKPFTIKQGSKFRMKATFVVQHEVLSGLKYVAIIKRKGKTVHKDEEMMGSYAPCTTKQPVHEKKFAEDEAPSGMMARGNYAAVSKFVDEDEVEHLRLEWSFDVAEDW